MIDNLRELSEVVTNVANRIVEVATENTSSGQYYVDFDDVSDLISHEDYLQYADLIESELYGREEILDLDRDGEEFDVNCGLAWCKNYEPLPEEDFSYGYLDVRPAPSLSHLADIGKATVDHLVIKGPFANLYGEDLGVLESDKDYVKAYQQKEPQPFEHVPMPMPDLSGGYMSYEEMQIQSQQRRQEGSQPLLQWVFNVSGQDISDPSIREQHPQEFKTLKRSMKLPNHAPEFTRTGAFLYGKPVLVYGYILAARNIGDEKRLDILASYCSFTADASKDYLEDCLSAADRIVRMDFSSPVVLFTNPHGEGHKHSHGDRFSIPAGKLKSMLTDLGYEAHTSLPVFLNYYTCEVAKEVQALLKAREEKAKPTLSQQMKNAEKRRQEPGQNEKGRDNERGD